MTTVVPGLLLLLDVGHLLSFCLSTYNHLYLQRLVSSDGTRTRNIRFGTTSRWITADTPFRGASANRNYFHSPVFPPQSQIIKWVDYYSGSVCNRCGYRPLLANIRPIGFSKRPDNSQPNPACRSRTGMQRGLIELGMVVAASIRTSDVAHLNRNLAYSKQNTNLPPTLPQSLLTRLK